MLWLTGCTSAVERNQQFAGEHGLQRTLIQGQGFSHVVYLNQAAISTTESWHVYIEGDGRPWIDHRFLAKDPTAPLPLMLRIMTDDPAPAVYVARPCYEGMASEPACVSWHWSEGRYSSAVVDSMVAVLRRLTDEYPIASLSLVGHSGGGALAMLMAPEVSEVDTLVTISGNLDIDAWTEMHGYSPLTGSRNPATEGVIPGHITQLHFLGGEDRNIPVPAVQAFLHTQPDATVTIVAGCGHSDCWKNYFKNKKLYNFFNILH